VRFDDRLLTVLNQPARDRHDKAVRWRQLVDLVARAGPNAASPVVTRALQSIRNESGGVEEKLRAAAARAVASLPLPLALLECFAADKLAVSAPGLAAANLHPGQWRALLAAADAETIRFVETLHPGLVIAPEPELADTLTEGPAESKPQRAPKAAPKPREHASPEPPVEQHVVPEPEPEPEPDVAIAPDPEPEAAMTAPAESAPSGRSLSEVVARIERRRRSRDPFPAPSDDQSADAPPPGAPALFRWECQPSGEIAWVDGAPRGALIGRSIARAEEESGGRLDREVVRAFAMRAPFRDAGLMVPGDGVVSGEWKISGVPAFDPADGRFAGYRGFAMRDVPPAAPAMAGGPDLLADPDSLRELVHEIKTPLNAIIGFAEIIEGQFLGPADRRYRERAADIVLQARLLLGAIDDLDFAAQLHASTAAGERRSDLGHQVESLAVSLRELAGSRRVELDIARPPQVQTCRVEPELLDRLLYRLCSTVIEHAGRGERLRLAVDRAGRNGRFSISRPRALQGATDYQLFDATSAGEGSDLRIGFTLRLVRGLARIAGGDLTTTGAGITLTLPSA
jgi:outer membrane biosynthesis protein TonB